MVCDIAEAMEIEIISEDQGDSVKGDLYVL